MSAFIQAEFDRFILDNQVIGFFEQPITLKSGRKSYWYVNWRSVVEDVYLTDCLANFVMQFVSDLVATNQIRMAPDCFYGVPEGATKLAIITQCKWAMQSKKFSKGSHTLSMGRGKPKEHGDPKDKYFVGEPKGATILLEDVTTTGGSLISAIDNVRQVNAQILAAIGLTNRMERRDDGQSVRQAVQALEPQGKPISYHHMSSATALLPQCARVRAITPAVREAIEREFVEFGIEPLRF